MMNMMNKKLSIEELAMVNGGSENEFLRESKLIWGELTGDPEAIVVGRLRGEYYKSQGKGTVVNHSPA